MDTKQIQKLQRIKKQLEAEKEPFVQRWKEIARYMASSYGDWGHYDLQGKKLDDTSDIYDNTANESSNLMADGLMGTCFGRSIAWFKMAWENDDLGENGDANDWLYDTEKLCYRQLNKSNFYDEARTLVRVGADFGTGVMWMEDDTTEGVPCFKMLHPKDVTLMENRFGDADVMFRDLWLTRDDAIQAFGEKKLPKQIVKSEDWNKKYKFCQVVCPAGKFDLKVKGTGEYVSVYWCDLDPSKSVKEERFNYKPFVAWRWNRDTEGTPYGTQSPAMMQLSNIKTANILSKNILQKSQMIASPPIKRTEGLVINLLPAGITDLKAGEDFTPINVTGDLSFTEVERERIRTCIRDAYYTNFFLMLSQTIDKQKTATEVAALMTEQGNIMAAFFNRLAKEFLEPVIEFVFANEYENGRLPDVPYSMERYRGQELKVDFISPMFLLQKMAHATENPLKALTQILSIAQAHPDILMKIDWDKTVDLIADGYNVKKEILLDDDQYQRMRLAVAEQRQAQEQMAQQMAQSKLGAENYKNLSAAPQQGSAAEAMIGQRQ
jgi:hypothetical protein